MILHSSYFIFKIKKKKIKICNNNILEIKCMQRKNVVGTTIILYFSIMITTAMFVFFHRWFQILSKLLISTENIIERNLLIINIIC